MSLYEHLPQLNKLTEELVGSKGGVIAAPEAAHPAVLAGLSRHLPMMLVGTPSFSSAENLANELRGWLGDAKDDPQGDPKGEYGKIGEEVAVLPAWEILPFERVSPTISAMGERMRILSALQNPDRAETGIKIVVASTRALLQKIPASPIEFFDLELGKEIDREALIKWLVQKGYRRETQVSARGEMAVRGGIIDIFASAQLAPGCDGPLRIEFFGDSIDSMRLFSLADQLAIETIEKAVLFPVREFLPNAKERAKARELAETLNWGREGREHWEKLAEGDLFEGMESWMCWLLEADLVAGELASRKVKKIWIQKEQMAQNARRLEKDEMDLAGSLIETWGADKSWVLENAGQLPHLNASFGRAVGDSDYQLGELPPAVRKRSSSSAGTEFVAEHWGAEGELLLDRAKKLLADGYTLVVTAWDRERTSYLKDVLYRAGLSDVQIIPAPISTGCIFPQIKLAVLTEPQLTRKQRLSPKGKTQGKGAEGSSAGLTTAWEGDLLPGTFVVHKNHGIGQYLGTELKTVEGLEREYLLIQYRGNDRLYVPAEQIGLLTLYSVGDSPRLNSLGGGGWDKSRRKARAEAESIARELVELYGERNSLVGHSFEPDNAIHQDLAASFPFHETPDQIEAINNTAEDMEKPVPMDRLIYGDVGFGKTEVAIRAAFKAIIESKQVALLVPTTLLARQHYETFKERYADFPIRVEMLSRFVSAKDTEQILKGLAVGEVDLVMGTHKLLGKDVKFKDLGLLIIDEEQRFGVRHKEKLKSHYKNVDILTLTATPIPRTLEMSLTGIRDYSLIKTPPVERHPILTYVGPFDWLAVKEAIRRELLREGQVFFVHNRIANIMDVYRDLTELVPEARIAVAHGRLNENQLEQVVMDFTDKKYDVLICTTIIESGIDMPRVNTLLVNKAESLGLGQLHQLRGRVGRAGTQAYAYLFSSIDAVLSHAAEERLRTIGETTALGSGFHLAMRDLEIRGAGSLLGFGQSGHMGAVGYDMYCDLVAESVNKLKGRKPPPEKKEVTMDLPIDARIPEEYVAEESLRLDAYRRLYLADASQIEDIEKEWRDRFGPLPQPAKELLQAALLRAVCSRMGIFSLSVSRRSALDTTAKGLVVKISPASPLEILKNQIPELQKYETRYSPEKQELLLKLNSSDNLAGQLLDFLELIERAL